MARPANLAERGATTQLAERADVGRVPTGMFLATALLVAASVSITFLAGPISHITDRAAESAQDNSIYRSAVLDTVPGGGVEGEVAEPEAPTRRPERFATPQDEYGSSDTLYRHRSQHGLNPGAPTQGVTTETVPTPVRGPEVSAK